MNEEFDDEVDVVEPGGNGNDEDESPPPEPEIEEPMDMEEGSDTDFILKYQQPTHDEDGDSED